VSVAAWFFAELSRCCICEAFIPIYAQFTRWTNAAAIAPFVHIAALSDVAGMALLSYYLEERLASELSSHSLGLTLVEPHERRFDDQRIIHAQA
jgi:hypothetical protein